MPLKMEHSHGTSGTRVLLVDDDPDQVEMYRFAFEDAGFVVASASTGAQTIAGARDFAPHVIVLDVRLPDMTGLDVCAGLKTDPRTDHIPVVLLTAAATPTLQMDAARAGCAAYLLKPCYPDQLIASIRNVLTTT